MWEDVGRCGETWGDAGRRGRCVHLAAGRLMESLCNAHPLPFSRCLLRLLARRPSPPAAAAGCEVVDLADGAALGHDATAGGSIEV